jgi:hypothetical protein
VKVFFRIQDKLLSESTRGQKGLTLVRFLLLFELLLVCHLLFLELFLELGVGFLEITQVVLEESCLSSPLLLQHVKLSLKIAVFRLLYGYALLPGSKLLVTTHDCFQLLGFLL